MIVHVFACNVCKAEVLRTAAQELGSPWVRCKCGSEVLVPMLTEWDLMPPSRRSDIWFGRLFTMLFPGAIVGMLALIGWWQLNRTGKFESLWPLPGVLFAAVPAVLAAAVGAGLLRRDIAASRRRLQDPAYRARLEAMKSPGAP